MPQQQTLHAIVWPTGLQAFNRLIHVYDDDNDDDETDQKLSTGTANALSHSISFSNATSQ